MHEYRLIHHCNGQRVLSCYKWVSSLAWLGVIASHCLVMFIMFSEYKVGVLQASIVYYLENNQSKQLLTFWLQYEVL